MPLKKKKKKKKKKDFLTFLIFKFLIHKGHGIYSEVKLLRILVQILTSINVFGSTNMSGWNQNSISIMILGTIKVFFSVNDFLYKVTPTLIASIPFWYILSFIIHHSKFPYHDRFCPNWAIFSAHFFQITPKLWNCGALSAMKTHKILWKFFV